MYGKICPGCLLPKTRDQFSKNARRLDGLFYYCKECAAKKQHAAHVRSYVPRRPPVEQRFWTKVQKCGHGDECRACCWIWMAALDGSGYGQFGFQGKTHRAHRIAYILTYGDIAADIDVLHKCPVTHNRRCVNPFHLYPGTHTENMRDKCLQWGTVSELTPEQLAYVRSQKGMKTAPMLARELGVSRGTISNIWRRFTFRHIL